MLSLRPLLVPAVLLGTLGGCASKADFPSLAPRPIERSLPPPDVAPPETVIPDDPQLPARLAAFVAAGHQGQNEFDSRLAAARRAVDRAGPRGSDSWIEAQQAVSRVEALRANLANALSELDTFAVDRAKTSPLSPADLQRIQQASAELQALAETQQQATAELQARLGS